MLTYPKSTMRVRCMPMHLSSGHVTLMPGKFSPPFTLPVNFPQSDLRRRADSRWALPQISSNLHEYLAVLAVGLKDHFLKFIQTGFIGCWDFLIKASFFIKLGVLKWLNLMRFCVFMSFGLLECLLQDAVHIK